MYIYIYLYQQSTVLFSILVYFWNTLLLHMCSSKLIQHHLQLELRLGLGPSRGAFGVPGGERGEGSAVNLGPGRLLAVKTRDIHMGVSENSVYSQ